MDPEIKELRSRLLTAPYPESTRLAKQLTALVAERRGTQHFQDIDETNQRIEELRTKIDRTVKAFSIATGMLYQTAPRDRCRPPQAGASLYVYLGAPMASSLSLAF